jgi:TatA/E family protein of Tat protein translocase
MGTGLLQPGHLLVILIIVLMLVGPGKLPEVGSALGKGLREFKRTASETGSDAPSATWGALAPSAGNTADRALCGRCHTPALLNARFCGACGQAVAAPV